MKNKELARKIKVLRARKGYSQEELAEKTGLSLRTIQRIENGEAEPRGDSLKRLATVFDVSPDEIVDWTVQEDNGFLISLNLSALGFFIAPILGILIPLIIWISKKDKIQSINETAKELLNFQITWIMIFFTGYIIIVVLSVVIGQATLFISPISMIILVGCFTAIMYIYNLIFIIVNSIKLKNGKTIKYYPIIRFLKK